MRSARRLLCGALGILALVACQFRPTTPESRAEYFIDQFIHAPPVSDDLRAVVWLTEGQDPDMLVTDLPTRTAVTYLRARARLGATLGVHATGTTTPTADRRRVQIAVTEPGAPGLSAPVRLEVELEKRDREWRVLRLHAES